MRVFALVIIFFFLFTAVQSAEPNKITSSQSVGPLSAIEMGYSPTTLSAISSGVPVYGTGDNLWIVHNLSSSATFTLYSPAKQDSTPPNQIVTSSTVSPNTALNLHSFSSLDNEGVWALNFTFGGQTYTIPILYVDPALHALQPRLSNFSLKGSSLILTTTVVNSSSAYYDLEGCVVSQTGSAKTGLSIPVPSSLGSGLMQIQPLFTNNNSSSISISGGGISTSFDFWFDLEYPYSYSSLNSTAELVTRQVITARSDAVQFAVGGAGSFNTNIAKLAPLKPGRYTLDAYFDSKSGLIASQARVLIEDNGTWVPLSSCEEDGGFSLQSSSQVFASNTNLAGTTSTWPASVLVMGDFNGTEGYSIMSLKMNLGRISFLASPWGVSAADTGIVIQSSQSTLSASSVANGSVYFVATGFPARISYSLTYGGTSFTTSSAVIASPYTATSVNVPLGRIRVSVTNNGSPLSGVSVSATNTGLGSSVTKSTDSNGNAVFLVPQGKYLVWTSAGNQSQTLSIVPGQDAPIVFSFSSGPSYAMGELYLVIVAVAGIAANVWAWIVRPRLALKRLLRKS